MSSFSADFSSDFGDGVVNLSGSLSVTQAASALSAAGSLILAKNVTYQVQYRIDGGNGAWQNFGQPTTATTMTVTGLLPGTKYDFQIIAIDDGGQTPSIIITDTTASSTTGGGGGGGAGGGIGDSSGIQAARIADFLEKFGVVTYSSPGSGQDPWGAAPSDYTSGTVSSAINWITAASGLTINCREYHLTSSTTNYNLSSATFSDDFTTLSLYNDQVTNPSGTWQPAFWWSPYDMGKDVNGVWYVNPFNSATPFSTYSAANSILSLRLDNTPSGYQSACGGDAFIGGQLTTANTWQHAVTGYWEIRCAIPNVPGDGFGCWIQDNSGAQQIDILESWASTNAPQVGKFSLWDPSSNAIVSQYYTAGNNQGSYDPSQFHQYGVEITSGNAVNYYVDRTLVANFPLPSGYTNTMFWLIDFGSFNFSPTGLPSSGSLPCSAQVDYVGYWTARPTNSLGSWMDHYPFAGLEYNLSSVGEQEYLCDIGTGNPNSIGYNPFSWSNGVLNITAETTGASGKTNPASLPWNSGCITSCIESYSSPVPGLFAARFGYFEIRCQTAKGGPTNSPGFWNIFALYPLAQGSPGSFVYPSGEIDIFEILGGTTGTVNQTIHHTVSGNYVANTNAYTGAGDTSVGFHTVGADVQSDYVTFYVDNVQSFQIATPADWVSNKIQWYMNILLAVCGPTSWSGAPLNTNSTTSGVFAIDYAGVWVNHSAAYPNGGTTVTKTSALFLDDFNTPSITWAGAAPS